MEQWTITVVAGPTAVGKTEAALTLAQQVGGEIINADSMQVYRLLDIGTAKPTLAEQSLVVHHLIDVAEPEEDYSVAQFRRQAQPVLENLQSRGIPAIVAGGTGLYLRGLIDGMVEGPPPNDQIRARYWEWVQQHGSPALHARLSHIDPHAASQIHPNDTKRIIRALEIYELMGCTRTELQAQQQPSPWAPMTRWIGLQRPWDEIDARINQRVGLMFDQGLVAEVEQVRDRLGATARHALGYREVLDYLEGRLGLTECQALVAQRTRRFARRQMIWLRADSRIDWYHPTDLPTIC